MREKQRLIQLYENEIRTMRQIEGDMDRLADIERDQLGILVEKAYKYKKAQDEAWDQICGDKLDRKEVLPILIRRNEIHRDFRKIKKLEEESRELNKGIKNRKNETTHLQKSQKKVDAERNRTLFLAGSFGVIFVLVLCFEWFMYLIYHAIMYGFLIPMLIIPGAGCAYNTYKLVKGLMQEDPDQKEQVVEEEWRNMKLRKKQNQSDMQFFAQKYDTVFGNMDKEKWKDYPYVEHVMRQLNARESCRKAKNDYRGIMEILRFSHPEIYVWMPEIFLIEEEQNQFLAYVKENKRKLNEYLHQTKETA